MDWVYLGTIQPKWTSWELFPNPSINGQFLRITFTALDGQPLEGMRSYALIRRYWAITTPPSIERAKKVWPTNNAIVIYNPLQQAFIDAGFVVCDYQIKLGWRLRDEGMLEPAYTVSLHEA